MSKVKVALYVLLMLSQVVSSSRALAADDTSQARPATAYNAKCIVDKNDQFDPALEIVRGPNKGKCLDSSYQRSIHIIETLADGSVRFANFRHQGVFWIAKLNPSLSKEIIFLIEKFPAVVPAAHTQFRIRFDSENAVQLTQQTVAANALPKTLSLQEIAFSVEAVKVPGENFDLFKGLQQHYGAAYRLLSMADTYKTMITDQHHQVRQYSLAVAPIEREKIIESALGFSDRIGTSQFYNTITKSCTTQLFKIFDLSLHYSRLEQARKFFGKFILDEIYPPLSTIGLRARGLIKPKTKGSVVPNLDQDQELIDLLNDGK